MPSHMCLVKGKIKTGAVYVIHAPQDLRPAVRAACIFTFTVH